MWLLPSAVDLHVDDPGRCRGHPWVDHLPDAVLIAAPIAQQLARMLPAELVEGPNTSENGLLVLGPERIGVTLGSIGRAR